MPCSISVLLTGELRLMGRPELFCSHLLTVCFECVVNGDFPSSPFINLKICLCGDRWLGN